MVDWVYVSALCRARMQNLIDTGLLYRMSDAPNREIFFKLIKDTVYADSFTESTLESYESVLEKRFNGLLTELAPLCPEPRFLDLYRLEYDRANTKIIFKSKLLGMPVEWSVLSENGVYPPEDLFAWIDENRYFKLPPAVSSALAQAEEEFARTGNAQAAEFLIDAGFAAARMDILSGNPLFQAVQKAESAAVDTENLRNIIRARRLNMDKALYIHSILPGGTISSQRLRDWYGASLSSITEEALKTPYGKFIEAGVRALESGGGFSELEKGLDMAYLDAVSRFHFVSDGPEAVWEYLSAVRLEARNLRIVFIGKLNDIKPEEIRARVREVAA